MFLEGGITKGNFIGGLLKSILIKYYLTCGQVK